MKMNFDGRSAKLVLRVVVSTRDARASHQKNAACDFNSGKRPDQAGAFSAPSKTSPIAAVKSSTPVLGTMMVLRRP
jgi:hypothetical protein